MGLAIIGNKTRVIHARMHFPLGEGKRPIEVFCLDPLEPVDYALSLGARTQVQWKCLIGGNRRWKRGPLHLNIEVNSQPVTLSIERGERLDNTFAVTFRWTGGAPDLTFGEVLAAAGKIPLPPYLGRDTEAADHDRYQTVFAKTEGSVAAPTAGEAARWSWGVVRGWCPCPNYGEHVLRPSTSRRTPWGTSWCTSRCTSWRAS